MDFGLAGKSALVAASTRGLGFAIARGLAAEGARVAVSGRTQAVADKAAGEIARATGSQCAGFAADVGKDGDPQRLVAQAVERFGGLDVLVTNAGGPPAGGFSDVDDPKFLAAVDVTLMSVVRLVRTALPYLRKSGRGRVINVVGSSVKEPIDGLILSNSIRLAVIGLARTIAREVAAEGITVNNVCPGRIMTQRMIDLYGDEASIAKAAQQVPMLRLGTPDEFAAMAVFLSSTQASYVTGQTIVIDGGLTRTTL
jgi:3-oxoacyl-[acyl-carrier protein] reductase